MSSYLCLQRRCFDYHPWPLHRAILEPCRHESCQSLAAYVSLSWVLLFAAYTRILLVDMTAHCCLCVRRGAAVQKSVDFLTSNPANPGFVGFSFTYSGDEGALSGLAGAEGLLSFDYDRRVQMAGGGKAAAGLRAGLSARVAARNASAAIGGGRSLASQKIDSESYVAWPLDRIDQPYRPLDGQYTYQQTGKGVRLYEVGAGLQLNHEEFTGRAVKGYDFVTPFGSADDSVECDPEDWFYGYDTFVRCCCLHY
jgi:hypothetical protein